MIMDYYDGVGDVPLALESFRRLVQGSFVSPFGLQFVHEIGDSETCITEQAWLHEIAGRKGVCVKSYRPETFGKSAELPLKEFVAEVNKLRMLEHTGLVKVLGIGCYSFSSWAEVVSSIYIVEEYAGPMTTFKLIKALQYHPNEPVFAYTYLDATKWLAQVAEALAYLHGQGVVHGDVRTQNIYFCTPEVHETDVVLGDLKPHRAVYMRLKGTQPPARPLPKNHEGQRITQASLQRFSRVSVQAVMSGQGGTHEHTAQGLSAQASADLNAALMATAVETGMVLPVIKEDPRSATAAGELVQRSAGSDGPASVSGRIPTGHGGITRVSSRHRHSRQSSISHEGHEVEHGGGSGTAAQARGTPTHGARLNGASRLSRANSHSDSGALPTVDELRHRLLKAGGFSRNSIDALTPLLDEVGVLMPTSPRAPGQPRRAARASWTPGVGATLRVGLPPLPGALVAGAAAAAAAAAASPGPGPEASSASSKALPAHVGAGARMSLSRTASARGATAAAAAAALASSAGGHAASGSALAGSSGDGGVTMAGVGGSTVVGASPNKVVMNMSPSMRVMMAAGPPAASGGSSQQWSWTSTGGRVGSVLRNPDEPAPWSTLFTPSRNPLRGGAPGGFARASFHSPLEYAEAMSGIDAQTSESRSALAAELRDQVSQLYAPHDLTMWEGKGGEGGENGGAVRKPKKPKKAAKSVSFATTMPDNKVSGRDLAAVYAAPELVHAPARAPGVPLQLTKATDVFAFAKVMYQLYWRCVLEPGGQTAAVQRDAIHAYARKVAGGFREELPDYWPTKLRDMIKAAWAQDPAQRPSMADLAAGLREMLADPKICRDLDNADKYHKQYVKPGQLPGAAYIPNQDCCTVS